MDSKQVALEASVKAGKQFLPEEVVGGEDLGPDDTYQLTNAQELSSYH